MPSPFIPVLPESAPFTPEQRAYLNGFLAGLFSHAPVPAAGAQPPPPNPLAPLTILFASQTGTAEKLAKRLSREAGRRGFAPTVHDLARYPVAQLASEPALLIVASTFGDGDPPDAARAFWDSLRTEATGAPRLKGTPFAVCALGDQNYPRFCQFGRDLDARLEALGGRRVVPRQECDVDYDQPFAAWFPAAFDALRPSPTPTTPAAGPTECLSPPEAEIAGPGTRTDPFPARLKTNRRLNAAGSEKDVRHFEIDLAGAPDSLRYEAGDALGVWPTQDPALADAIIDALGADPESQVPGRDDAPVTLRDALLNHYELGRIPSGLLAHFAEATRDPQLIQLTSPDVNGELLSFLRGRDILDLLQAYPGVRPPADLLVRRLRKLQPRLYSISSSPKAHPAEVHLTVSAVRYHAHGRERRGAASCFLAERCTPETPVPVFVHGNPAFRPPAPDVPLIMIGPGTGVAPFRAFLQERKVTGAPGRNWLFFGDQREAFDYLYRDELEAFLAGGTLNRLDLAWSRNQATKVYVQHRMLEAAPEIWRWLEDGAAVYVCGDASRMARDVDAALHRIIETAGSRSPDQARDYISALQSTRRYQRDVY